MIMFRTSLWNKAEILEAEVIRKTKSSVWIAWEPDMPGKSKRRSRDGDYEQWHDTWEEAKAFLLQRTGHEMRVALGAFKTAKARYEKIDSLTR